MPPVVTFLASVASLVGLSGAVAGAVVLATAVFAASKLLRPRIGFGLADTDRARQQTVRSTTEPQKLVYGETMVSGPLTYAQVSGADNRYLHQVVALAGHELTAIKQIVLDDKIIDITNSSIYNPSTKAVISGFFGPKPNENDVNETIVYIDTRTGAASQTAYSGLLADSKTSTEYLSTHRGDGIASVYTKWTLNEGSREVWDEVGNVQNIKALVQGKKLYDPRLEFNAVGTYGQDTGNSAYITYDNGALTDATYDRGEQGRNPALMIADFLMDDDFGLGISASKIDWPAIVSAADACDELVDIPNSATQKRFFGSGVVFGGDSYSRSIEKILSAMNGSLFYSQGKYICRAGVYVSPSESITENDIIGEVKIRTAIPRADRFNQISGFFIDPDENYKMMEFGPVTVSGAYARDNGEVLDEEVKLPFTDNFYCAQRIAFKQVNQSFLQTLVTVPVNLKGMRIAIGDRVNLTLTDVESIDAGQWSPKVFKCIGWGFAEDGEGGINLTLLEDESARYADPDPANNDYSTITAQGTIDRGLADVPSPSSFNAQAGINSIELSWTNPPDTAAWEQIWVYQSDTTTPPTDPIIKFRGSSYTHLVPGGTSKYYWIQAVRYPKGATPTTGNTNTSKSPLIPFGAPDAVTANKVGNAVMDTDSIDTAQIVDEAISSTKIATSIQSDNWSSSGGTAGWQINRDGSATFQTVTIQGTINASDGTIGGLNVDADKIYEGTGTFNNANTGFYVDDQGQFSLKDKLSWNGTNLSIDGGGTFSGALSAATGTFTGELSGGTISIGSNNAIFKADNNGIYLGNATFASAPFSVTPAGVLTANSGNIGGSVTIGGTSASTVESGANAGATALQDADTGVNLGLDDGSIGGITITSTSVESSNFSSGSAGFKLASDGTFETGDGTFRGAITATSLDVSSATVSGTISADNIDIDGVTLDTDGSGNLIVASGGVNTTQLADNSVNIDKIADTIESTNYVAGTSGWKLTSDGTFEAGSGTFRGAITATSGTFAGSVSVNSSGSMYGGSMSSFNTGSGFFLGYDTDAYKFSVGDASGKVLTWDGEKLNVQATAVSFTTGGAPDYDSNSRFPTSIRSSVIDLNSNTDTVFFDNRFDQNLTLYAGFYVGPLTSGTISGLTNAQNAIMSQLSIEVQYAPNVGGSPGTFVTFGSAALSEKKFNSTQLNSNYYVKTTDLGGGNYRADLATASQAAADFTGLGYSEFAYGITDEDFYMTEQIVLNDFPRGEYFLRVVVTVTDGTYTPYPSTGSPALTNLRRLSIPNALTYTDSDQGTSVVSAGSGLTYFNDGFTQTLIDGGDLILQPRENDPLSNRYPGLFITGRGESTDPSSIQPLGGIWFYNSIDDFGTGSGNLGTPDFAIYVPKTGDELLIEGNVNFENNVDVDGTLSINGVQVNPGSGGTPGGSDTQVQYNNSGAFGGSANFTFNDSTNTLSVTNVTTTTGGHFRTNTNANPLQVSRSGATDNQVLNIGVVDTQAIFNYIEDTNNEGAGNYGKYLFQLSGNSAPTGPVTVLSLNESDAVFAGKVTAATNYVYGSTNYHYILSEDTGDSYIGNINGSFLASSGGYYYGANLRQLNSGSTSYSALNLLPSGLIQFEQIVGATAGSAPDRTVPFQIDTSSNATFAGKITAGPTSSGSGSLFRAAGMFAPDPSTQQGASGVPLVVQATDSDTTVFGALNQYGYQNFAINISSSTNSVTDRGSTDFYNKNNGTWSLFLRATNAAVEMPGDLSLTGDSRSITMLDGTTSSQPSIAIGEQSLYGFRQRWDSASSVQFEGWWASTTGGAVNRDFGSLDVNSLLWTFKNNVNIGGELRINGTARIDSTGAFYPANIQGTGKISVLNGSAAQGIRVESLYAGTSYASDGSGAGFIDVLNGYRVQGNTVIDSGGNIALVSTGSTSPVINFSTGDAGIDMAIRANGEALEIYEPEDASKVHFKVLDDIGVNAVFGLRTGSGDGTVRIDASGNATLGTISSGAQNITYTNSTIALANAALKITNTGSQSMIYFTDGTNSDGSIRVDSSGNMVFNARSGAYYFGTEFGNNFTFYNGTTSWLSVSGAAATFVSNVTADNFITNGGFQIQDGSVAGYGKFSNWVQILGSGFYTTTNIYVDLDDSAAAFSVREEGNSEIFKISTPNNTTQAVALVAGTLDAMNNAGSLAIGGSTNPFISFHDNGSATRDGYIQKIHSSDEFYFGEAARVRTPGYFQSDVATGTAPLNVASTTVVGNLNADLLDGYEGSTFVNNTHTSHQASSLAVGWYTIATVSTGRATARFGIRDVNGGDHQAVTFYAAHHYGTDGSNTLTVLDNSRFAGSPFRYIRIKDLSTYDGAALQVYIDDASNNVTVYMLGDNYQSPGWVLKDWIPDATDPGDVSTTSNSTNGTTSAWASFTEKSKVDLDLIDQGGFATTGEIYAGGDTVQYRAFHDNYHPNADAWTTSRTITLGGDLSGSVSINGSANVTLTATVADDSHNHTIANIDNLQGSLDNKVNTIVTDSDITTRMNSGFYQDGGSATTAEGWPVNGGWYHLIANTHSNTSNYYSQQFASDFYTSTLYYRSTNNSGTTAWQRVFMDNYHPNADAWTTSRTLTVGNTGKSVNGSANVSWSIAEIGALPLTGGTVSGQLIVQSANPTIISRGSDSEVVFRSTNESASNANQFYIEHALANVNLGNTRGSLRVIGSADTLTTARSIGISGAVSGSVSFNGSADVTISSTANAPLSYIDTATANYGTIKVDDDRGVTWAGYGIRDDWTFMASGATTCGIYNDTDNEWAIYITRNAETRLYHNGSESMRTVGATGIRVGVSTSNSSDIYMSDADHGERRIHCNSNRVGFLTSALGWGSYCDDSGNWTSVGNVTAYSDERIKSEIKTIENPLEKVLALRGVNYIKNGKYEMGVIAQEVEKVIPEVVNVVDSTTVDNPDGITDMRTVSYGNMVALCLESIKELTAKVEELENKLKEK